MKDNGSAMNEATVANALFELFRAGIRNASLLDGITLGLHRAGKSRLEIMDFFWRFQVDYPLEDEEGLEIADYCSSVLMGDGPARSILRLPGDPEDSDELATKVRREARLWKRPTK